MEKKDPYAWTGEGFDWRTEIKDPKTGMIIRRQSYVRYCEKGKATVMMRGGKLFYEAGDEVPASVDRSTIPSLAIRFLAPIAEPVAAEPAAVPASDGWEEHVKPAKRGRKKAEETLKQV